MMLMLCVVLTATFWGFVLGLVFATHGDEEDTP